MRERREKNGVNGFDGMNGKNGEDGPKGRMGRKGGWGITEGLQFLPPFGTLRPFDKLRVTETAW